MALLTYALRSLWARRMTTLPTALGVALLTFVLSASGMLSSGMRRTMASAGVADRALVMQHDTWAEQGSRIEQSVLGRVAAAPGVARDGAGQALVTGETVSHLMIGSASVASLSTVQIRGVGANVLELRPSVRVVEGRAIRSGTAEAIVGRGIVGRYEGLVLGGNFELSAGRPATVVGVFEDGGSVRESEVWVDLDAARSAFSLEGYLSSVTAKLEDAERFDAFREVLVADKTIGLEAVRESAYYTKISSGIADVIAALGFAEAFIFSLGAICATMLVLYGSVAQRRREVGVLRALGFRRGSILMAFLVEAIVLSLAGGVLGAGLSLFTPLFEFESVNFATGQDVTFHFEPTARAVLTAMAAAGIIGVFGGGLPAVRAARMDPVAAMRP